MRRKFGTGCKNLACNSMDLMVAKGMHSPFQLEKSGQDQRVLVMQVSYHCAVACGRQALLNAQYNYGQGRLACRLRAALTAAVFDKARCQMLHIFSASGSSCQLLYTSLPLVPYHANIEGLLLLKHVSKGLKGWSCPAMCMIL